MLSTAETGEPWKEKREWESVFDERFIKVGLLMNYISQGSYGHNVKFCPNQHEKKRKHYDERQF